MSYIARNNFERWTVANIYIARFHLLPILQGYQGAKSNGFEVHGHGVYVPFWLRDLIVEPVEGRVFAAFRDVVNVKALGFLIGIASARIQPNPITIVTDLEVDFKHLTNFGDKVLISNGDIVIARKIIVSYDESNIWVSEPLHGHVDALRLIPSVHALKTLIKENGRMEGAGPVIDYIMKEDYPSPESVPKPIRTYYQPLRKLMRCQAPSILDGIVGLIGLGPGLTPSGDDLLMGFLAARTLLNGASDTTDIYLDVFRSEFPLLCGRTTLLSEELLYWASRGQFSKLMTDIMNSIADGDISGVRASALNMMTQFGATSGTDTLIGIVAGLSSMASP